MTLRALVGLSMVLAQAGCAGAFLPRSEPIDLGLDKSRVFAISVEGPEDMPEWGELLWSELASTLSSLKGVKVAESAPGVLLVKATVESWDYQEQQEVAARSRFARNSGRMGQVGGNDYYRRCTAVMGVTVEIRDPAVAEPLAIRKYLGVEGGTQDLPMDKFRAPRAYMRRAAGKVAQQLADDLEAGRR